MPKVRIVARIMSLWFASGTACNSQEVQYIFSYHFSKYSKWAYRFNLPAAPLFFINLFCSFAIMTPTIRNSSCHFFGWHSVKDLSGPLLNIKVVRLKLTLPSPSTVEKQFVSKAKLTAQCFLQSSDFDGRTVSWEAYVVQVSWNSRNRNVSSPKKRVHKFPLHINAHILEKVWYPFSSLQWVNRIDQNK